MPTFSNLTNFANLPVLALPIGGTWSCELRVLSRELTKEKAFGVWSRLTTRGSQLNMDGEDQKDLSQTYMRL